MNRRVIAGLGLLAAVSAAGGALLWGSDGVGPAAKSCELTVDEPALRLQGELRLSNSDALTVTIAGTVLRCPGATVELLRKGDAGEETSLGTAVVQANGTWEMTYQAVDRSTADLRLRSVPDGGRETQARVRIDADLSRPKLVLSKPAPSQYQVVRLVTPQVDAGPVLGRRGSIPVALHEPGWVAADEVLDGGLRVAPEVVVTGGAPGTLRVIYNNVEVASAEITTSPQTLGTAELGNWTLPDGVAELALEHEAGGNDGGRLTDEVFGVSVDSYRPPAPELVQPNPELLGAPVFKEALTGMVSSIVAVRLPEVNSARPHALYIVYRWQHADAGEATRLEACWIGGPQRSTTHWRCADGHEYSPGEVYQRRVTMYGPGSLEYAVEISG